MVSARQCDGRRLLLATRAIESAPREGGFVLLRDLATELVSRGGVRVAVFAVSPSASGPFERLKAFRAPGWSGMRSFEFLLALLRHQSRYDLVHTAHVPTAINVRLLGLAAARGRLAGVSYLQTITALPDRPDASAASLLWGDHLVVQTPTVYRRLRGLGRKLSLIAPWPSPRRVAFDSRRREATRLSYRAEARHLVLFPGELSRLGPGRTLEGCVAALLTDDPKAVAILASRFDVSGAAAALRRSLGAEFPDRLLDVGETNDIVELLEAADLVVYPAPEMTGKFHPPLVLTEALTLGTPVLTSDNLEIPHAGAGSVHQRPLEDLEAFGREAAALLRGGLPRTAEAGRFTEMVRAYERCYEGHEVECF